MRHTNLLYRSPVENTPSYRLTKVTKDGTNLNYTKNKNGHTSELHLVREGQTKKQYGFKSQDCISSFCREARFKQPKMYCP